MVMVMEERKRRCDLSERLRMKRRNREGAGEAWLASEVRAFGRETAS